MVGVHDDSGAVSNGDDAGDSQTGDALAVTLGAAIRTARKSAGATLQELSKRTGLSQSFLSQAENGHTVPSVLNLHNIARSLGTSAHTLLSRAERSASLVRADDGGALELSPGAVMRRCSAHGGLMGPNEVTADAGTSASAATEHPGEEFVYLLSGILEMEVGTARYRLAPGDTLYYDATVRHRWHNPGDTTARFLITSSPPF